MKISAELKHTFTGHAGPIYSLEHSAGEDGFYSGSGDKLVSLWYFDKDTPAEAIVNVGGIVYSICYIAEKNYLLIGEALGGLHVIDMSKKQEVRFLTHHKSGIFDIKYSNIYQQIYTVSADGLFAVWSMKDFTLLKSVAICDAKVRSIAISPDESELAIACGDGLIRIIDVEKLELKITIAAHQLSANVVKYHPSQPILLSGGRDALLKYWDRNSYTLLESIPAHNYAIYSIAFSHDNNLFATASRDKTIKIWNAASMNFELRIDKEKNDGHSHSVNKVLWARDKNLLISAGDDKTIKLWDIIVD